MNQYDKKATIKATGESITVYPLKNGNYYDSNAISEAAPPSCPKAGKKEFVKNELKFR